MYGSCSVEYVTECELCVYSNIFFYLVIKAFCGVHMKIAVHRPYIVSFVCSKHVTKFFSKSLSKGLTQTVSKSMYIPPSSHSAFVRYQSPLCVCTYYYKFIIYMRWRRYFDKCNVCI